MPNVNKAIVMGVLGRDPETKLACIKLYRFIHLSIA